MNAQLALVICVVLLVTAIFITERTNRERLPLPEALWFHAVVTWPILIKAVLGSFVFADGSENGITYTLSTYGPAALSSVVILFARIRANAKLNLPAIPIAVAVAMSVPFVFSGGAGVSSVLPALFIIPLLLRRGAVIPLESWFRTARFSLLLLVVAIAIVALTAESNVIGICRVDKCSLFGEVLTSPITNNGNFAGVAIALLSPWALLGVKRIPALFISVAILMLADLSGSRSAAFTTWVVIALVVLVSKKSRYRTKAAEMALVLSLMASIATAVIGFSADFATFRGSLWIRARELFVEQPIFGFGPYFWSKQVSESAFIANYSPHNFWLEVGVSGGVAAIICLLASGFIFLRTAEASDRFPYLLVIIILLVLGTLEAPVQIGKLGLAPFAHLLPLMVATTRPVRKYKSRFNIEGSSNEPISMPSPGSEALL